MKKPVAKKTSKTVSYKPGTKRIKSHDLRQYVKDEKSWKLCDNATKHCKQIISYYVEHNTLNYLVDEKTEGFLKGHLTPEELTGGARIKVLPDGNKLARGGFSLFAKNLKVNTDQKKEWDVCYQNASGTLTYLYSENKIHLEKIKKAKIVDAFAKQYPNIVKQLDKDIKTKKSLAHLGLYILLNTYMRVGNLEYYIHHRHKGLTTLQKKDVTFNESEVSFSYIGKDGVPQLKKHTFNKDALQILKNRLTQIKDSDFIFADDHNHPLHSYVFTNILYTYTKMHFYPHIIRSHHADISCRTFLQKHKKADKQTVINQFMNVANDLGHKKFNKKKNEWQLDYKVTISNYIRPEYVQKMQQLYE